MKQAIEGELRPSNFSSIFRVILTSVVKLGGQTRELKLNWLKLETVKYLCGMSQDSADFGLELDALSELLKIRDTENLAVDAKVSLPAYYHVALKVQNAALRRRFLDAAMGDLEKHIGECFTDEQKSHYNKLKKGFETAFRNRISHFQRFLVLFNNFAIGVFES